MPRQRPTPPLDSRILQGLLQVPGLWNPGSLSHPLLHLQWLSLLSPSIRGASSRSSAPLLLPSLCRVVITSLLEAGRISLRLPGLASRVIIRKSDCNDVECDSILVTPPNLPGVRMVTAGPSHASRLPKPFLRQPFTSASCLPSLLSKSLSSCAVDTLPVPFYHHPSLSSISQ